MDDSTINHPIVYIRDQYLSTPPWLTIYLTLFLCISHPYPNRVVELSNCSFPPQFTTRTPPANTSHVSILFFPYPHHHSHFGPNTQKSFGPNTQKTFTFPQLPLWFNTQETQDQDWLQVQSLAQSILAKCCCILINTCCIVITIIPLFVITYIYCSVFDCTILVQNIFNKITQSFILTQKSQREPEQ